MRNIYKESKNPSGKNGARTSAATSVIHQKSIRDRKSTVTMWKSNRNPAPALSRTTTLKEVSENLHLNVMYLGQLFKKKTKKFFSLFEPFTYGKSENNCFCTVIKNIKEIASEIGYNNTHVFL